MIYAVLIATVKTLPVRYGVKEVKRILPQSQRIETNESKQRNDK